MPLPLTQRFVGIDLGTTNSSVCWTRYNTGQQKFDEPEPIRFGNDVTNRSLLLLDASGEGVIASGWAVYRHPDYLRYPERVRQEFKLDLGKDPEAGICTHLLARELLKRARISLNVRDLAPGENVTTVGVPADWQERYPERVAIVGQAVARAGFPNVDIVPEPVAAMYYHAFLGEIRFEDRPQQWLVVDIGGGTTDLAIVKTTQAGAHPVVLHTYGENFGGKDFDQLLLEKLVLARCWSGPPPTSAERLALLQFVRKFKEDFSDRVNRGGDQLSRHCSVSYARNPVTLSRAEFDSDDLGLPLQDRFAGILKRGFIKSGLTAADIDKIILTGGSARWYFVREAAVSFLGRVTLLSSNPELTIVKGLALAQTGFKVPLPASPEPQRSAPSLETLDLTSADQAPVGLDREACRKAVRILYAKEAAKGGAIAILVSPIPYASTIPLTYIEAELVKNIARLYGYNLTKKQVTTIVGGLLAGGALLRAGVMEAMTFVPGAGWVLKGGVAATAIPALGEAARKYFEGRRFKDTPSDLSVMEPDNQ